MRNFSNHIKFIKLHPSNECTFFNIVVPYVDPKKSSRKSDRSFVTFCCNRSRIQPVPGSSLICWKKPRVCFTSFPLPMARQIRNGPSSLVFHQQRAFCTGVLYTHGLKTGHVELTSCCCCAANGRYSNYYHSRTPYYNDSFFTWWNDCFSETFKHLLPCLTVTFTRDLEKLSLPGQSGRAATPLLKTWSPQSGSVLVALVLQIEAIWNKCRQNKCTKSTAFITI